MSSITITGGGLIGLFCADILSSNHDVTIIEINAEIGFPANFPGIINQSNNKIFLWCRIHTCLKKIS